MMVLMELLKYAFPYGAQASWNFQLSGCSSKVNKPTLFGHTLVRLAQVPAWLSSVIRNKSRVDNLEINNLQEVINYTNNIVGTFTLFIFKAVVNRHQSSNCSAVWVPIAQPKDTSRE